MRKRRKLLLFFIPLFLLIFSIGYAAYHDYSQIQASSMPNYLGIDQYGEQFYQLKGNLSPSGLSTMDNRPAYLSRWQAIYTENIKTGASYPQEKYDVYNLEETQQTDTFGGVNDGYGLLPFDPTIIRPYLSVYLNASQEQQDGIWNQIQTFDINSPGYYLLNYTEQYFSMGKLVQLAGGKWDHSENVSNDLSDMSEIKGTNIFDLSPPPKINSASISGTQLTVDFNAYGYSSRDIQLEVKGDKGSKIYTYYGVSDTTFHDTWTKEVSDFSAETGTNNLQVIIHDGFWRTDQANVQRPLNLAVTDIQYSPSPISPNDQIQVSVLVTNQSSTDITTDLVESVNGNGGGTQTITIPAASSIRVNGAHVTATFDSQVNVAFDVNPSHTQPSNETDWSDNHTDLDIPIDNSENLYIHFRDIPDSAVWNDKIPIEVVVGNQSDHPITTTAVVMDNYKTSSSECVSEDPISGACVLWHWTTSPQQVSDTRTFTIPAHDEVVFTETMPAGWDYYSTGTNDYQVTITAEVNPSHSQPPDETTYLDNTVTGDINVNPVAVPKTKVRLYE